MNQLHFREYQAEFFRLYEAKDYPKAEAWIRMLGGLFPERAAVAYNWRMCLAVRQGQPEQAIDLLHEALDLGLWWPPDVLLRDPDLAPLKDNPRYLPLVKASGQAQAEARQASQAALFFNPPVTAAPHSLALVLHGRGDNGRETLDDWEPLARQGWLVTAAQSSQLMHAGAFCWDNLSHAESDVAGLLDELQKMHPSAPGRLLLCGFGQGADLAIRLALSGRLPASGFIAVATSPNPKALLPAANPARPTGQKGYLVFGGQDHAAPYFALLEDGLRLGGVNFLAERDPELEHAYPPRFAETIQRALEFLYD